MSWSISLRSDPISDSNFAWSAASARAASTATYAARSAAAASLRSLSGLRPEKKRRTDPIVTGAFEVGAQPGGRGPVLFGFQIPVRDAGRGCVPCLFACSESRSRAGEPLEIFQHGDQRAAPQLRGAPLRP